MDRDNDIHPDKSCAELRGKGGNWYYGAQPNEKTLRCLAGSNNLNGLYGQLDPNIKYSTTKEETLRKESSMNWSKFTGNKFVPLKSAAYMVRDC